MSSILDKLEGIDAALGGTAGDAKNRYEALDQIIERLQNMPSGGMTEQEVMALISSEISKIVSNAPEQFDTLKELADWIGDHEDVYDGLVSAVNAIPISAGSVMPSAMIAGATAASAMGAFAEGLSTSATGMASHAEGLSTTAYANHSHAEGNATNAQGQASHAEGYNTITNSSYTHAEGNGTHTTGEASHAEGSGSYTSAEAAHAEGYQSQATGQASHAEGHTTEAYSNNSHSEGYHTSAYGRSQHVFGEYNVAESTASKADRGTYVEIVGNGASDASRSNARTLDWAGNESLAGNLTLGKGTANETTITAQQLASLLALLNA